jgi:hypothetical protein
MTAMTDMNCRLGKGCRKRKAFPPPPLPETKQIFPDLQLPRVRFNGNPFNLIFPAE